MTQNFSQSPADDRLAISGEAPPASAETYFPLTCAMRLIVPSALPTTSNFSQAPGVLALATSGEAPASSAVTHLLFAPACRLIAAASGTTWSDGVLAAELPAPCATTLTVYATRLVSPVIVQLVKSALGVWQTSGVLGGDPTTGVAVAVK